MSTIMWSQIEAECGNFREGFVAIFRKYEGQPTDEKDGANRIVKVTIASFAHHMGIPKETFRDWVSRSDGMPVSSRPSGTSAERNERSVLNRMTPERKAEVARELLAEPEVADAVVEDHETVRNINQAHSRTETGRELTRSAKEYEAKKQETGPAPWTPATLLPLLLGHAYPLRDAAVRITEEGTTDDGRAFVKHLGEDLIATGNLLVAAAGGGTVTVSDDELQAWMNGEVR